MTYLIEKYVTINKRDNITVKNWWCPKAFRNKASIDFLIERSSRKKVKWLIKTLIYNLHE